VLYGRLILKARTLAESRPVSREQIRLLGVNNRNEFLRRPDWTVISQLRIEHCQEDARYGDLWEGLEPPLQLVQTDVSTMTAINHQKNTAVILRMPSFSGNITCPIRPTAFISISQQR
jgi:hypothetical protein